MAVPSDFNNFVIDSPYGTVSATFDLVNDQTGSSHFYIHPLDINGPKGKRFRFEGALKADDNALEFVLRAERRQDKACAFKCHITIDVPSESCCMEFFRSGSILIDGCMKIPCFFNSEEASWRLFQNLGETEIRKIHVRLELLPGEDIHDSQSASSSTSQEKKSEQLESAKSHSKQRSESTSEEGSATGTSKCSWSPVQSNIKKFENMYSKHVREQNRLKTRSGPVSSCNPSQMKSASVFNK